MGCRHRPLIAGRAAFVPVMGGPMEHNLLIIDDISENIQLLGHVLAKENYSVSFATDGQQALDMVPENEFDLILLDIMMPYMDGYEVCRRLKKMPGKSHIPVIFLTAKTEAVDIVKGFEVGAVDYVTKPFNAPELLARVRTHIELKNARDTIETRNRELARNNETLARTNTALAEALDKIKVLEGILPICSFCNKIRDDAGSWNRLEHYIMERSSAKFSHGICPACMQRHYPDLGED